MSVAKPKILVLDDHESVLFSLRILHDHLFDFAGFLTATEALTEFEQHHAAYEVALIDRNIPGELDGDAIAAKFHEIDPAVSRICISALSQNESGARYHATMPKPFGSADEMRELLATAINQTARARAATRAP